MKRPGNSLAILALVLVIAIAVVAGGRQTFRPHGWQQDVYSTLFWIDVECCSIECYLQRTGLIDYQYDPIIDGVMWRVRLADWFSCRVESLNTTVPSGRLLRSADRPPH